MLNLPCDILSCSEVGGNLSVGGGSQSTVAVTSHVDSHPIPLPREITSSVLMTNPPLSPTLVSSTAHDTPHSPTVTSSSTAHPMSPASQQIITSSITSHVSTLPLGTASLITKEARKMLSDVECSSLGTVAMGSDVTLISTDEIEAISPQGKHNQHKNNGKFLV